MIICDHPLKPYLGDYCPVRTLILISSRSTFFINAANWTYGSACYLLVLYYWVSLHNFILSTCRLPRLSHVMLSPLSNIIQLDRIYRYGMLVLWLGVPFACAKWTIFSHHISIYQATSTLTCDALFNVIESHLARSFSSTWQIGQMARRSGWCRCIVYPFTT